MSEGFALHAREGVHCCSLPSFPLTRKILAQGGSLWVSVHLVLVNLGAGGGSAFKDVQVEQITTLCHCAKMEVYI